MEFPWSVDDLPTAEPVLGSPIFITTGMMAEAINKMKQSKTPGPSGIVTEMLKAAVEVTCPLCCDLANAMIPEKFIPDLEHASYNQSV